MTRIWIVTLVLLGAIAPLGCQSDPCNERQGLFGRWRGWRQDTDMVSSGGCCSCGSSLGTPVYQEGTIVSPGVSSGIPMAPPSLNTLPGPVGS